MVGGRKYQHSAHTKLFHLYTKLCSAVDAIYEFTGVESRVNGHFECTGTWYNAAVLNGVLDRTESITDSVFYLSYCVLVWTWKGRDEVEARRQQERERERERGGLASVCLMCWRGNVHA